MTHDDSVPHDDTNSEMCRMHGEAQDLSTEIERLRTRLQRAEELLRDELKPYMEDRADAEYSTDSPNAKPNEEMRLLTQINDVLRESS